MTSPIPAEDPLRDAAWFASQIGVSVDYVRHNTATLPHHKVGRLVRFDDHCIDELRRRTDELIDDVCASEPASGTDRIVVPGTFEAERREQRRRDGIPLSTNLVAEIDELASGLGTTTLR